MTTSPTMLINASIFAVSTRIELDVPDRLSTKSSPPASTRAMLTGLVGC